MFVGFYGRCVCGRRNGVGGTGGGGGRCRDEEVAKVGMAYLWWLYVCDSFIEGNLSWCFAGCGGGVRGLLQAIRVGVR